MFLNVSNVSSGRGNNAGGGRILWVIAAGQLADQLCGLSWGVPASFIDVLVQSLLPEVVGIHFVLNNLENSV